LQLNTVLVAQIFQPAVSPNSIRQGFEHLETQDAFTTRGLEIRDTADWKFALQGPCPAAPPDRLIPRQRGLEPQPASVKSARLAGGVAKAVMTALEREFLFFLRPAIPRRY
jgi:hypothetical protein